MSQRNDHPTADKPVKRPLTRKQFIAKWTFAVIFAIVFIGLCTVFGLLRAQPDYWKDNRQFIESQTPEQLAQIADQLESRVEAKVSVLLHEAIKQRTKLQQQMQDGTADLKGEGSDPAVPKSIVDSTPLIKAFDQELYVTTKEVNAWLETRFDEWLDYRDFEKPKGITLPMIAVKNGEMVAAFKYEGKGFSQLFSARVALDFQPTGKARLKLTNMRAGKLPIPATKIGEYLEEHAGHTEAGAAAGEWLAKLQGYEFKPKWKTEDKHIIHLRGYKPDKMGVHLSLHIEPNIEAAKKDASIAKKKLDAKQLGIADADP